MYSTLSLQTDFTYNSRSRSKFKWIFISRVLPSTTCSLIKVYNVLEEHTAVIIICSACLAQSSSLKMEDYIPPKHPWTSKTIHATHTTSYKIVLFIATDVRSSNPILALFTGAVTITLSHTTVSRSHHKFLQWESWCNCHADARTESSTAGAALTKLLLGQNTKAHHASFY
jgi:hypothetical protein